MSDKKETQILHAESPRAADPSTKPKRKVVISVDGSKYSAHALDWAVENLLDKDDDVTLLHVFQFQPIPIMGIHGAFTAPEANSMIHESGKKQAITLIKELGKRCVNHGFSLNLVVLLGPIKQGITDYVNKNNVDLMLIASRGLGTVGRFFLGSVSDYCLHHCNCPVLVVKDTLEDEEKPDSTYQHVEAAPESEKDTDQLLKKE